MIPLGHVAMASSTSAITPLTLNVPAVVRWTPQGGVERYLGVKEGHQPCLVTAALYLDETQHAFSCKLRIPIKIKSRTKKICMYVLIEAEETSSSEPQYDNVPQNVIGTFVTSQHCSSAADVLGLRLTFSTPATLVGPKTTIESRSVAMRRALESLLQLAKTDHLTIYFPCGAHDKQRLTSLAIQPKAERISSEPFIDTLYAGEGGRILHSWDDLLYSSNPVDAPVSNTSHVPTAHDPDLWDTPPTYDQVASQPPPAFPSKRPKVASSSDIESPPTKKRVLKHAQPFTTASDSESVPKPSLDDNEPWKRAISEQLAVMAAQIASMRDEMHTQPTAMKTTADAGVQTMENTQSRQSDAEILSSPPPPSTCSTVEDSLEDRLVMAERNVASLRGEMACLRDSLSSKITQSVQDLTQSLDIRLSARFQEFESMGEQLDELRAEVGADMHELLDDMLSGVKLELRDFVHDEMKEAEDNIKDRISSAINQATLQIDLGLDE
ncbi:hypothetical protein BDV97DRAFT_52594 [Delphinella strobiligena]|nr:hypothetical protein BDV97DRAFT_52594 [Delphinella strobiligena]